MKVNWKGGGGGTFVSTFMYTNYISRLVQTQNTGPLAVTFFIIALIFIIVIF